MGVAVQAPESQAIDASFQIALDLHLEFYEAETAEDVAELCEFVDSRAPVLALLGDIALASTPFLVPFIASVCTRFDHVILLAGNHELYADDSNADDHGRSVNESISLLQSICDKHNNIHLLNRSSIVINGTRFLGATLWSLVSVADIRSMNDFDAVADLRLASSNDDRIAMYNAWHEADLAWLQVELSEAASRSERCVILFHHPPRNTPVTMGRNPKKRRRRSKCPAAPDALDRITDDAVAAIACWAFGHTHFNSDTIDSATSVRLVSNQHAYPLDESHSIDNNTA